MKVLIRQATVADLPRLAELLYTVQQIHANGRPDLFVSGTRKYDDGELQQILRDSNERPVFVAERQGYVVGYAFCMFESAPEHPTLRQCRSLYLDDLCVDEACRGEQIGRALYEHVVAYAKERECRRLTLNVWTLNSPAMSFYEKMGMQPYKICMEELL